jgi:alpha-galactosidase
MSNTGDQTAQIVVASAPTPEFHYVSGRTVYCEQMAGTRLIGKYWSANGLVENGGEFPELGVDVPCQAFALNMDGQSLDWGWELVSSRATERDGKWQSAIALAHTVRPVNVTVHTEVDGTAFLSRWLDITNTASRPAALSALDIFSGVLASGGALRGTDFEQTPYQVGRFTGNNWGQEGRFAWSPLLNGVVTGLHASGPYGTSGFHDPWFVLTNRHSADHFVFYLGWSGLWKADLLCDTTLRKMLHVRIGPAAPAPMRVLQPGETVVTPKVHIGHLNTDLDACVQAAHAHIRRSVILHSPRMPRPLVTHNSYGALGLDRLNEEGILRDVEFAHELGCEAYMVDAGWYGKGPAGRRNEAFYSRFMGDWVPGSWFPRGLDSIVANVHARGMLFGLWIEPEGIGLESELYKQHPDWVVRREGKPVPHVAERLNLDYSNPAVCAWLETELVRVIRDYRVDIIRFDGAPMSAYIGEHAESGYTENILWRHYEFLYGVMERLAAQFPDLIIENCCGGGGRLDLGILSRSHRTQITDEVRMPRAIQILNGITLMLPPEICLVFPVLSPERLELANLDFLLRVALFAGFYNLGFARRAGEPHPGYLATLKRYLALHKTFVAPLLPGCRVYHHTPVVRLEGEAPTPYCVWEYTTADGDAGLVGIFKLTDAPEPVRFTPRGLDAGRIYRVTFDNSGASAEVPGYTLQQQGLTVQLPRALSSELLVLQAL